MFNENLGLVISFGAGVLSFLSPCVLPLIPGYLAIISGYSTLSGASRAKVFVASVGFVAGFSAVFVFLMLTVGELSKLLKVNRDSFELAGGIVVMLLGLFMLGFVKFDFLNSTKRFQVATQRFGLFVPFVMGAAFAFGWTPCVGPILGAIVFLGRINDGAALPPMLAYCAGLGIPFILSALLFDTVLKKLDVFRRNGRIITVLSGVLVFGIGLAIATGKLMSLVSFF